jgi:hypothetical protein
MESIWCPSTNEWIKKNIVCIHNGILAIKNNEIMSFSEKWMELEITLSETSQTEENKCHMFSLT